MKTWKMKPARDLGLSEEERQLSVNRESGLFSGVVRLFWWTLVKLYLRVVHRLSVRGRGNLPHETPFVVIANHASHLDVFILASQLRATIRASIFPIAAGDTFFETRSARRFATLLLNALPMWRRNCGRHAMNDLRERLVDGTSAFVLFPEGTRTRSGAIGRFRPGIGMLVAETDIPIIPCWIEGAHRALPPKRSLPRPTRLRLVIGEPIRFPHIPNQRDGWDQIAAECFAAVEALAGRGSKRGLQSTPMAQ
jgi:1-acyl-sn-glycerol-3-phosphate acyltransferase